ncbi:MAG: single-stranded DNA-binding protein [Bacteroidales bacterium]|nr:single-stranded DNA-binding protein [Bacteroidales bacterium]
MIGVNKVILIGNVGREPEAVLIPNEMAAEGEPKFLKKVSFPLATNEVHRNRMGQRVERTDWHSIVCWRGVADVAERVIHKGAQLFIEGRLRTRQYEGADGERHFTTEVIADTFEVLTQSGRTERSEPTRPSVQEERPFRLPDDMEPLSKLPF